MAAEAADPTLKGGAPCAAADPAGGPDRATNKVRTAVVIVHGMGERRPMETLDGFVRTALRPSSAQGEPVWDYYSRPAEVTGSYEARRYIAPPRGSFKGPNGEPTEPVQDHTEIYEYHWSFLMTGNRFADLMPTTLRLFLRRPRNVPDPLFGIWRAVWSVVLTILLAIPALVIGGYLLDTDTPGWIIGLVGSAVVLLFWFGLFRVVARALVNSVTTSFVDVVRYLDMSPHSYATRRAIRGGLVDLLHALHDGRYSRIVVVGHSLGAIISYDALTSFWAETHELHAGSPPDVLTPLPVKLAGLAGLEEAADRLVTDGTTDGALDDFQDRQFAVWQALRLQGNPWRVTDFITVGTPMALADLLVTRPALSSGFKKSDAAYRRDLLDGLVRRGALVRCPPRPETLPVESNERRPASYRWRNSDVREVLGSQSPFAVTRWTNLWFPVIRGELRGDWFGGALRPLFGPGIRDIPVRGNEPERFKRGSAHTEYFRYPDKADEGDVAWHIRNTLALQTHAVFERLLTAPPPDPSTAQRRVHLAAAPRLA
jgi:hypothetical protein